MQTIAFKNVEPGQTFLGYGIQRLFTLTAWCKIGDTGQLNAVNEYGHAEGFAPDETVYLPNENEINEMHDRSAQHLHWNLKLLAGCYEAQVISPATQEYRQNLELAHLIEKFAGDNVGRVQAIITLLLTELGPLALTHAQPVDSAQVIESLRKASEALTFEVTGRNGMPFNAAMTLFRGDDNDRIPSEAGFVTAFYLTWMWLELKSEDRAPELLRADLAQLYLTLGVWLERVIQEGALA